MRHREIGKSRRLKRGNVRRSVLAQLWRLHLVLKIRFHLRNLSRRRLAEGGSAVRGLNNERNKSIGGHTERRIRPHFGCEAQRLESGRAAFCRLGDLSYERVAG